jgi:hypothetical protein
MLAQLPFNISNVDTSLGVVSCRFSEFAFVDADATAVR